MTKLNKAEQELKELIDRGDELEEELRDVGTAIADCEMEIDRLKAGCDFTYGTGVVWNGIDGVVVGLIGDCVEVIVRTPRGFFEERVRTDSDDVELMDFDASVAVFNEFREAGVL